MGALFESYNDSGALQFSADAFGYVYYSKQTVTTVHGIADVGPIMGPAYYVYWGCSVTVSVSSTTGATDFHAFVTSDTNTPVMCIRNGGSVTVFSKDSATVTLYLFVATHQCVAPTDNNVGLQLYSAAAQLTYDSKFRPMILSDRRMSPNIANGASTAVTLPSGKTYAWGMLGSLRRNSQAYNPPSPYGGYPWNQPYTIAGVRKTSANTFAIEPLTAGVPSMGGWYGTLYPPASVDPAATAGGIMTVDVTGLVSSGITARTAVTSPTNWTNTGLAGTTHSQIFYCNVTGGTPSAYSWSIENLNNAGALWTSGQTGNQITLNTNLPFYPQTAANLRCDVTIDGMVRSAYASIYLGRAS